MPIDQISRRDFLKFSGALCGSILSTSPEKKLPSEEAKTALGLGRVTIPHVRVYAKPSYKSAHVRWIRRDELVEIHNVIKSPSGPKHNPYWYRITGGYAHRAYLQWVANHQQTVAPAGIPTSGRLGQVTVPFVTTYRLHGAARWEPLYRIYYGSVHWITNRVKGPDQELWYEVIDELLHLRLYLPAKSIRLLESKELTPLSTDVPPENKKIEVSLQDQTLRAYENGKLVFESIISSGIPSDRPTENGIPTATPTGKFHIALKMPSKHMGNGEITADYQAYELLGVPWCCFFVSTGVAFHGTFWHDNFGTKMSHGCVNMRNEDALWLYRWTNPVIEPDEWYQRGWGTVVRVTD